MSSTEKKINPDVSESDLQQALLECWSHVLSVDDIDPDTNFFDLHGDSHRALDVYECVCERFGCEFPSYDISEFPTVRSLAKQLINGLHGAPRTKSRYLKTIQQGTDGVIPLYLVHGGDGFARIFHQLASNLSPDIPVHAFQWSGWSGSKAESSLEDMARAYTKELLDVHSGGPLRLGGYCIGGVIAVEMFHLLREAGVHVVGPMLIWDSPNIKASSFHRREPWFTEQGVPGFKEMTGQVQAYRSRSVDDGSTLDVPSGYEGGYRWVRARPALDQFLKALYIYLFGVIPIRFLQLVKGHVPIRWRWRYSMSTMFFAQRRYRCREKVPVDVIFFRSDCMLGRSMNQYGWWSDPFLGFGELCDGELKGYAVGGGHIEVLAQPAGARVVNELYERERGGYL